MQLAMEYPTSPIPAIFISLAPPQEPLVEPYSPFTPGPVSPATPEDDEVAFRPSHLSPPPALPSSGFARQLSPLRPSDSPNRGQGLERERFESLLKASRERNAAVGAKKPTDLRKEVALKAHKSKQMERRAFFLSKIQAPPSPSATCLPKTPPDSPSVFHYTLPSPGLMSPLALFESLDNPDAPMSREPWVEQVDFRIPKRSPSPSPLPEESVKLEARATRRMKPSPSLEQITARLRSYGHVPMFTSIPTAGRRSIPLPAFLKAHTRAPRGASMLTSEAQAPKQRPTLSVGLKGRLHMPIQTAPTPDVEPANRTLFLHPKSPQPHLMPKLQITTTVIPRSSTKSPEALTEANLFNLNAREQKARDMMSTLKRRTLSPLGSLDGVTGLSGYQDADDDRKGRRISAPAELPHIQRVGFSHRILRLPGAF